jgi:acyl-CoA synthetase (AMP-forming)/AMP-acid ligase II
MGACVAVSETVNGAEVLIVITEVDERRLPAEAEASAERATAGPADASTEVPDADSTEDSSTNVLKEFWASAAKTIEGAVATGHGLSIQSVVFVEPRSLEKTSSGKPRRRHYQKLYREGRLAVLHEKRSPMTA